MYLNERILINVKGGLFFVDAWTQVE